MTAPAFFLSDLSISPVGATTSAIAQGLASVWFASLWQGLLLAAIIATGLKIAPHTTARVRFFVCAGLALMLLLLPGWSAWSKSGTIQVGHSAATLPTFRVDTGWAFAIAALWVSASIGRAIVLLRSAYRLNRLRRTVTLVDSQLATSLLGGYSRRVQLCTSAEIEQPCVIGFFTPQILLPTWLFAKATEAEIRQIVLHETEHLLRFDDWSNLLQKLALVLFPLSPALVWAERRLCAERERACDESVIRMTNAPVEYASCLANLAEQRYQRRSAALSVGAWEKKPELSGRIESILLSGSRMKPWQSAVYAVGLMIATVFGAARLATFPQLISFVVPEQQQAEVRPYPVKAPEAELRNVVYRQSPSRSGVLTAEGLHESSPATIARKKLAAARHPRPLVRPRVDDYQSWLVVKRWEGPAGEQVTFTRISQTLQFPVVRVVDLPPGWYVFTL